MPRFNVPVWFTVDAETESDAEDFISARMESVEGRPISDDGTVKIVQWATGDVEQISNEDVPGDK